MLRLAGVETLPDHASVWPDHDRADGHVVRPQCPSRLDNRGTHSSLIFGVSYPFWKIADPSHVSIVAETR